MRNAAIRVYASITGLSPEQAEALEEEYDFSDSRFQDESLELEYEGLFFPIDDFVDSVMELLPPEAEARIDYIDNDDWTITRHTLSDGELTTAHRNIDDMLEKYTPER